MTTARKNPTNCRTCAECGGKAKRLDTRSDSTGLRRRFECRDCRFRWTTIEFDLDRAHVVAKIERMFIRLINELQQEELL